MNKQQEVGSEPDGLNQQSQSILAQVKTLSHEQLNLYLHETKWLLGQLGYIMPDPQAKYPQVHRKSSDMELQVDALREALVLERVRRQLAYLQTEISICTKGSEEETPSHIASLLGSVPNFPDERKENASL